MIIKITVDKSMSRKGKFWLQYGQENFSTFTKSWEMQSNIKKRTWQILNLSVTQFEAVDQQNSLDTLLIKLCLRMIANVGDTVLNFDVRFELKEFSNKVKCFRHSKEEAVVFICVVNRTIFVKLLGINCFDFKQIIFCSL